MMPVTDLAASAPPWPGKAVGRAGSEGVLESGPSCQDELQDPLGCVWASPVCPGQGSLVARSLASALDSGLVPLQWGELFPSRPQPLMPTGPPVARTTGL